MGGVEVHGKLRVLIADDHALVRKGLVALLAPSPEVEVVGEAQDGWEAVDKVRVLGPDVVLMDINMPGLNGIEATRRIREQSPQTRVIMLTVSDSDEELFQAIRAGAQGYLLKTVDPDQLLCFLRGLSRGEAPISPLMAGKMLDGLARGLLGTCQERGKESLTPREKEVLRWVALGASNREIAERMFISENTVKNHIRNILDKLHTKNRVQAAAYAMRHGLIENRS
ncbi:MAG: response regulator transcription factor [Clostridia bacterium]|nr:response regulator transcription factor [Clostridia bacterium]